MSDIFGEMVEARTTGRTTGWSAPTSRAAARHAPTRVGLLQLGRPYPMRECAVHVLTTQDNGGVHMNSSIINHAFYPAREGLPGAIGIADAERIFYRALDRT